MSNNRIDELGEATQMHENKHIIYPKRVTPVSWRTLKWLLEPFPSCFVPESQEHECNCVNKKTLYSGTTELKSNFLSSMPTLWDLLFVLLLILIASTANY